MNDINLKRKINKHYKIMEIFKINNKKKEKIKCEEGAKRPYSIYFIEVKISLNNFENKIIKNFRKIFKV